MPRNVRNGGRQGTAVIYKISSKMGGGEGLPQADVSCHELAETDGGKELPRAALNCQNIAETREE